MEFNYKKAGDIATMELAKLGAYKSELKGLADNESFKDLSVEELIVYQKNMSAVSEAHYVKSLEGKADSSELKALSEEISELKGARISQLEKALEMQGKALANQQSVSTGAVKSFAAQVKENLSKPENLAVLKALKSGEKVELVFDVKAAGSIVGGNIIGSNANLVPEPEAQGVINTPQVTPFITDIVDMSNTSSAAITWVDEKNLDGDAAFTLEGALKPLIDMDFEPQLSAAKKVAGRIKVSDEMLDDVDWMTAEINKKLRRRHDIALETGILFGDNGTNPEEFDGITENAAAFVGESLAGTVDEANNFDVIRAAIRQIVNAGSGEFISDYVLINPDDGAAMDMTKGTDGHYVLPTFVTDGGKTVSGVRIIEKPQIPTGSFLVGDFQKSHVRNYKSFSIKVGYDGNDFSENMRTIIGESRSHHYISTVEYTAFVYDTFANGKASLETA